MGEKDEEFDTTKKNMNKALDNMQAAIETESQGKLEDAQRAKEVAHDNLLAADRKAHANQNALEEARTLLEHADRARRMVEMELADTNETLGDMTCTNQAIQGGKMKIDSEIQTLSADLDELTSEAALSEEKAQKAMIDAARLADDEQNALKGGKKAMGKMDTRIRELESELDAENRRLADAQKGLRKSERKIKELTFQQDEDRKDHERMQALIDQLQGKIKSYKKQIEEAEEIAALNLAKFRQTQSTLATSQEAADASEQALAKLKTRARSASLAPM